MTIWLESENRLEEAASRFLFCCFHCFANGQWLTANGICFGVRPLHANGRLQILPIEGEMPVWAKGVFNHTAKIQLYFVKTK